MKTLRMHLKATLIGVAALTVGLAAWAGDVNLVSNEKAAEQSVAALLLTAIYQRAGWAVNIAAMPPVRANKLVLSGEKDGEVARVMAYAMANPSLIKVEPSYYYLVSTAFAKAHRNISIKSKADLKNYKVGVVLGVAHAKSVTEGLSGVEEVASSWQLFQMLNAGRIDVAIDTSINGGYLIKKHGLTDIAPVGELARLELFHMLAAQSKALAPKLSATILALKNSGELSKMAAFHEQAFLSSGAEP